MTKKMDAAFFFLGTIWKGVFTSPFVQILQLKVSPCWWSNNFQFNVMF